MSRHLLFAGIVLVLAAVFASHSPSSPEREPQASVALQHGAGSGPSRGDDGSTLVLKRDSSGQFHMTAQVNGEDVRFMVDTGADVVALTVEDARRIGLDADPDEFEPIARTASGVGYGTAVRLERLEIDGHEIGDVDAVVMDGLTTNLLGQSVLRRLGRMELRGDTMVLHTAS